jgi:hypothetical protein
MKIRLERIMKAFGVLSFGLAVGFSAHAALVKFQLSPPGTDTAVGLSPSNQVPVAVNSKGSGGEISAGIIFDTDSSVLQVAVGYGSAAGFKDLTRPAIAMHIHGPAGPGTNADVLVSLVPDNFPASDPAKGGVIFANLQWPTNDAEDLLTGLTYLNIHTTQYPGGEIRGQLIPINEPPVVVCPPPATNECGTASTLVTLLSDPEGDALTVVWVLNGTPAATNTLPARGPGLPAMDSFTEALPRGSNVVEVMVADAGNNKVSCSTTIVVVDTTPPVIVSASADPSTLWPPNHKLVNVTIHARVTDTCSDTTWKIINVTSNEPENGHGDGNTSPDWIITGDHTLKLRAERSGHGDGRVYTITLQAKDASGNLSEKKRVTVTVPRSRGHDND